MLYESTKKMHALISNDIESELSYAYLHAVVSQAGMSCKMGNRHEDGNGIDATVTAWLPEVDSKTLTEVDLKVQLKANIAEPSDDGANYSFRLRGRNRVIDLTSETVAVPRIGVVLSCRRSEKNG